MVVTCSETKTTTMNTMDPDTVQGILEQGLHAIGCPTGAAVVVTSQGIVDSATVGDMNSETPVVIGSISKSLTGLAVMQLADRGLIDVQQPLTHYLPNAHVLPDATVHDVARHCSGLRSDSTCARTKKFRYSNRNYNLLGELVEKISGLPFMEYVQRNIIDLHHHTPAIFGHVAFLGHYFPATPFDLSTQSWIQPPSGGIAMNIQDAAHYLQSYLVGDFSLEHMLIDAAPADGSPAVSGVLGDKGRYGYGWIEKEYSDHRIYLHSGKVPGVTTLFALVPDRDVGVALLVPAGDFLVGTPLIEKLGEALILTAMGEHGDLPTKRERVIARTRLTVGYALFLVFAMMVGATSVHWNLPLVGIGCAAVIAGGVRLLSGTPTAWIYRFAPDFFCVILVGILLMAGAGIYAFV